MGCKGYYGHTFFDEDIPFFEHRAKNGTANSTSSEKGTDNKKNNTSQYNHEYYMRNKEKWTDNKEVHDENSKDSDTLKEQEKEFDIDAAARDVIRGKYGNGAERKAALGDDYAEVQKRVNELMKKEKSSKKSSGSSEAPKAEEKKSDGELKTFEEAKTQYYDKKNKNKTIKHSDDWGSVLVRDLF